MAYGITINGLEIKTQAIIESEVESAIRAALGKYINTTPQSIFGQLKGIFTEREALLWELVEALYYSQYPDTAEGTSFDNVLALTGLLRLPAKKSTAVCALFGTPLTDVPALTQFGVEGVPAAIFASNTDVTLGVGVDEVQDVTFTPAPGSGSFRFVYNGVQTALIQWDDIAATIQTILNNHPDLSGMIVAGSIAAGLTITYAGDDGKQPQPELGIADNTLDGGTCVVAVVETIAGAYQALVDVTAINTGPTVANAKSLNQIVTPISGLDRVFNPADAIIGRNIETTAEARLRRNERIQISIAGPVESIRKALLDLNLVEGATQLESVLVFDNITTVTDFRGLPPKSIRAYVYQAGGATDRDQEIADTIWVSKAGGIEPNGTVIKTVIDSMGFPQTVKFSRPTIVNIYLDLTLTTSAPLTAAQKNEMKTNIAIWGNALGVGQDVIVFPSLVAQIPDQIGNIIITDVIIDIGTAPGPIGDANIPIDSGIIDVELSRWDTANIQILP